MLSDKIVVWQKEDVLAECDIANNVHALCLTAFLADGFVYTTNLPPAYQRVKLSPVK